MPEIKQVTKKTDNPFVNLYELDTKDRLGKEKKYYVSSRAVKKEELKLVTHDEKPDGVVIYALSKEKKDRVLLIRQYRYSLDEYIYEFPAGLVDPGENFRQAAVREVQEETGLTLYPLQVDERYERPFFTTVGMTDECCGTVFGYVDGEISSEGQEDTEDIQAVLADREEVRRILKEERVAIMCAYMLMHFLKDEEPFGFLK
jgi:ADP-ribose pyrophosphatase